MIKLADVERDIREIRAAQLRGDKAVATQKLVELETAFILGIADVRINPRDVLSGARAIRDFLVEARSGSVASVRGV